MLKGNKGEWSELYVFTKLLVEGKLFQSDANLVKDENNCYEVIKTYRETADKFFEFEIGDKVSFSQIENGKKISFGLLEKEYLREQLDILYDGIIKGKSNSFEIKKSDLYLKKTQIENLKASSKKKSDLKIRIYDHRLAKEADLGFSIKSQIGSEATLFNTGIGNNFVFEIENKLDFPIKELNVKTYKKVKGVSKISARLRHIKNLGLNIKFTSTQSDQLQMNLKMIDGDLPQILAHALLYKYLDRKTSIKKIVDLLEERDPLNFYNENKTEQKLYDYKIKRFLTECALGMTSETPWNGIYDATGGVIVARKDGEIVCFHIYDTNLLREYLISNTMFEQPSTGEDENNPGTERTDKKSKKYFYGWFYEKDGSLYIKINLQVRFIKSRAKFF